MSSGEDNGPARPDAPFGEDEDSYADIWSKVEGADDGDEENSEAFTEFAASPGAVLRGGSLRRKPPSDAPELPDHTTADAPNPLMARDVDDESDRQPDTTADAPNPLMVRSLDEAGAGHPDITADAPNPLMVQYVDDEASGEVPGQHHTADDVRSLLDKVMEEALPTNPRAAVAQAPAFPEDGTPTIRPPEGAAPPSRSVGRDTSTMLVDAESAAIEHAVGAAPRPASFDALPSSLSDEIKAAPKVLRGQPAEDLSHLTNDLEMDVVATAPHGPNETAVVRPPPQAPPAKAPPPPQPPPPRRAPTVTPPDDARALEPTSEPALELAYDPRRADPAEAPPRIDPDKLLDEVTPKSSGKLMIGLAVVLIGLMLLLVLKSLL